MEVTGIIFRDKVLGWNMVKSGVIGIQLW